MFLKATRLQIIFLIKQKGSIITFYILLFMVLRNFAINVISYQNTDVTAMIHPMRLLLLSSDLAYARAEYAIQFILWYPFLVVCPAGFTLLVEKQTGQVALMVARLGNPQYKFSKLLAAFAVTTLVFSVPFFLEILLNCLSFPLAAQGNLYPYSIYDAEYQELVGKYLFHDLYIRSPYLYAITGTFILGILSGILGAFTVALSSIFKISFRIVLCFPAFFLLYSTLYLPNLIDTDGFVIQWYHYFMIFDDEPKNALVLIVPVTILIIFSIFSIFLSGRMDCV